MASSTIMSMENSKAVRVPYNASSKYSLNHFSIAMWFNNDSFIVYSNKEGFLDASTKAFSSLKQEAKALFRNADSDVHTYEGQERNGNRPIFSLIRRHPECNILLTLLDNETLREIPKNEWYPKTCAQLEKMSMSCLDEIADSLIKLDKFKYYYILADKSLRDAVIKQGYEDKINISARELECLWIVSQSRSAKEAAKIMNISPSTTEKYLKKIKSEFNGKSIPAIIVECIHRGIFGKMHYFK